MVHHWALSGSWSICIVTLLNRGPRKYKILVKTYVHIKETVGESSVTDGSWKHIKTNRKQTETNTLHKYNISSCMLQNMHRSIYDRKQTQRKSVTEDASKLCAAKCAQ